MYMYMYIVHVYRNLEQELKHTCTLYMNTENLGLTTQIQHMYTCTCM